MKKIALVLVLFISSLILGAYGPAELPVNIVDPRVWEDLAGGGTADFLIRLDSPGDTADLARGAPDKISRTVRVVEGLQKMAQTTQAPLINKLRQAGVPYHAFWVANVIATRGDAALVRQLASMPGVLGIEPNRAFTVPLETPPPAQAGVQADTAGVEWNINFIKAPQVWALGFSGQGSVVAVADTGIEWTHAALKPHYRGWDGTQAVHDYNWWDAIHTSISGSANRCGLSSKVPCDDHGHGTHVTGTATGDDGAGNQIGVAPGAKWIGCRNMDNGVGRPETYIECLQFFISPTDQNGQNPRPDLRPDVISNSYGCPPSELCAVDSLLAAVQNVRAAGIFMSVAAGNKGPACSTIQDPPSFHAEVFTVGSVDSSGVIASNSSRGPVTADGSNRRKPDISAPGVGVRSAYPFSPYYASMSGTSMATPHVAGAVALLWGAFPALRGKVAETESLLENTAVVKTTSQGCGGDTSGSVPNNVYGYGMLDLLAAYNQAKSTLGVYSFSGVVRTPDSSPLAGALISDGLGHTALSDAQGSYSIANLSSGDYHFVISKTGYSFNPEFLNITLGANQVFDFVGTSQPAFKITGKVTFAGKGLGGVRISDASGMYQALSNPDGSYQITSLLADQTYTFAPQVSGWIFAPVSRTVKMSSDQVEINFEGQKVAVLPLVIQ
jgi:subtilisin family serine protease